MPSTIYLVRHTQYDLSHGNLPGRLPVPLSAEGLAEAEKLRAFFADKNITKIFSSAVERCLQTSQILSNGKVPLQTDRRLLEGMSAYQGFWLKEQWHFYSHLDELGGETFDEIQARMMAFFESVTWEDGKNYVICSHGDPLYSLYAALTKVTTRPKYPFGEPAQLPADYQNKGSIRELIVEDMGSKKITVGRLIEQQDL